MNAGTLPDMMRAAFLEAPGELSLRDVPVPRPGPGEVLVRVESALTCGTDVKMFLRGHARLPLPAPFGHEMSGRVAASGHGVTGFAEGDAVVYAPTAPCGSCRQCRTRRENLCPAAVDGMVRGAFAEYVLLPARIASVHLFHRPANLGAAASALLEPLACVVHGADRIDWSGARSVAVLGDGAIALLFARVALLRGAGSVLALGRHDARLAVARAYGAHAVRTDSDDDARRAVAEFAAGGSAGGGADIVIECVGTPATWRLASDLAGVGGTVMLFGGCAAGAEASFDAYRLHYEEIDHIGAFHYTPRAVREALRLLAAGHVDGTPLITHSVPLGRLGEALELATSRAAIKVEVVP